MTTWIKKIIYPMLETKHLNEQELAALQPPKQTTQSLKDLVLRPVEIPENAHNGDMWAKYHKRKIHLYDDLPLSPSGKLRPIVLLPLDYEPPIPTRASTPRATPPRQTDALPEIAPPSFAPAHMSLFEDVPNRARWTPANDEDQPRQTQKNTKQIPAMDAENSIRWLLEDCRKQGTGEHKPIEKDSFLL